MSTRTNFLKKIADAVISTRLTAVLFLVFGAAMGYATFIENDFNTETSKALIFNAWWFDLIMVLFAVNFIGNIKRYQLFKKEKLWVLLFHLAFILIIVGAGITRYISYEGLMPINEGETTSVMFSEKKYISVIVDDNQHEKEIEETLLLAQKQIRESDEKPFKIEILDFMRGGNHFMLKNNFKGENFEVEYVDYVANARPFFVEQKSGDGYLQVVESSNNERNDNYIEMGEYLSLAEADISFENEAPGKINIYSKEGVLFIKAHRQLRYTVMATKETGLVEPFEEQEIKLRALYTLGNLQFVIPSVPQKGEMRYRSADVEMYPLDMLKVTVKANGLKKEVALFGGKYINPNSTTVKLGRLNYTLSYGPKKVKLPFAIKLNDFILEKYPGSNSPKSFTSRLTIIDEPKSFDYNVFMNNVLDHKGYRFFQSSYDEVGGLEKTILSVNHDKIGTWVTYIGYGLLFTGLIMMLASSKTYFGRQRQRLRKMRQVKTTIVLLLLFPTMLLARSGVEGEDVIKFTKNISKEHAAEFGKLILQDPGGRMKPVNTFGSELLRKLTKKDHFNELSSDQVLLSMYLNPKKWEQIPLIYIKKDNTKLRDILGIPHEQKFATLSDFFTKNGDYILLEEATAASKKKVKSKFEQSLLDVDGRVVLLYIALQGDLFKIIPIPNDEENTWVTSKGAIDRELISKELPEINEIVYNYKNAVKNDITQSNFSQSSNLLNSIKAFQKQHGLEVIPTDQKVDLELFYNKNDIFKNLFWQYMLASLVLLIVVLISVFKNKSKAIVLATRIAVGIVVLLFIYHTVGLGIRWYISGHAPWSNGYESMIYVAWATLFFGLIVGRKSGLTIAATTFVTSMILMVAHWNWMDPTIGNLVPVLDSYWLMIHVAIIVASYGPFAIGMILGMINLILFVFMSKKNKVKLDNIIKELTIINELSIAIGLVMLTIGNFLGAIWANESWGRYWGWDPKETWALISIMVYAFVLHMRLVPGLRGKLNFNIASVFAFASILMTYLGVNHLLSGLHSYATGEAAPIPNEILGWLLVSFLLSLTTIYKSSRLQAGQ